MVVFDKVTEKIHSLGSPLAVKASLDSLPPSYPDSYTWQDIRAELITPGLVPGILVALLLPNHIQPHDTDDADRTVVEMNVSRAILPESTNDEENDTIATRTLGLEVYRTISTQLSLHLTQQALLTLAAFTREADPWSTNGSLGLVTPILESQVLADDKYEVRKTLIAETILEDFIRPLFAKSKPEAITISGRKTGYKNTERKSAGADDSPETKPWKYTAPYSITVFKWAVEKSDEQIISENWPLYIPVLVTLAEDPDTTIRARGLKILLEFLSKFPNKSLAETGLGQVFTDAVMPTLSYLPGLTPADESVQLLKPAYSNLVVLSRKLYPEARYSAEKGCYLDRVLRDGVFTGYDHSKEHVKVAEVLVNASMEIVEEMGIYSIKHLKILQYLFNMYSPILDDPFSTSHPSSLIAATKAVQIVLRNCWPRMDQKHYQDEIVKMLTLSWINILDDVELAKNDPSMARLENHFRKELQLS
ncbi:uncharacterized protein MKZ38_005352 [Zalerion maritima]|uniref:Uncharacterized protein n=1 Tax=Zalerion maritima TaxID=339359 RepID=A0AAD5RW88_9PEZI|nr:uncharacterized protein MKZ38_005352 [Zalerion maritima]